MVKSMLHEEKRDSGTGRGCSKPGGTAVLSFVCAQVMYEWTKRSHCLHAAWATKPFGRVHESVFRHQGGQPKVSHGALSMRSSWNPPLLGTTIWSTPSELWQITRGTPAWCVTHETVDHWTMLCTRNEPSHYGNIMLCI